MQRAIPGFAPSWPLESIQMFKADHSNQVEVCRRIRSASI
jgi:hypothetical protein